MNAQPHRDVVVVHPDEFERVRQCLTSPLENPSPAAEEGAKLLRSLAPVTHFLPRFLKRIAVVDRVA